MVTCPQDAEKVTPWGAFLRRRREAFRASLYFAVAKEHGALAPLEKLWQGCPVSTIEIFMRFLAGSGERFGCGVGKKWGALHKGANGDRAGGLVGFVSTMLAR